MKCTKDFLVVVSIFLVCLGTTSGILASQIQSVDAKLDSRNEIIYSVPHLQNDIIEIKQDVKEIKEILRGDFSK